MVVRQLFLQRQQVSTALRRGRFAGWLGLQHALPKFRGGPE
jgi:hypothetical protein